MVNTFGRPWCNHMCLHTGTFPARVYDILKQTRGSSNPTSDLILKRPSKIYVSYAT